MSDDRADRLPDGREIMLFACRLYPAPPIRGEPTFAGSWGGIRVRVIPKAADADGQHTHVLMLGQQRRPHRRPPEREE